MLKGANKHDTPLCPSFQIHPLTFFGGDSSSPDSIFTFLFLFPTTSLADSIHINNMYVCTARVMRQDGYTCITYQAVCIYVHSTLSRDAVPSSRRRQTRAGRESKSDLRDEESVRLVGWRIRNAIRRKPCCCIWATLDPWHMCRTKQATTQQRRNSINSNAYTRIHTDKTFLVPRSIFLFP